ncbi:hypothetical protein, partial [Pseudoalteromonas sp. MMG012]|uniref:hypothetical protein n=1 Tax=Pseudoalteromonas sp. MMG012 TaxID=2822686 RepID=UPI001B39E65F
PSRFQRILKISFPTKTPISYKIYSFVAHDGGDLANARKQKTAIKKLRLSFQRGFHKHSKVFIWLS